MLKFHPFAKDAALTVLYIGGISAIIASTITLLVLSGVGAEFSHVHWTASLVTALGWMALPVAPRFYRSMTGHSFMSPALEAQEL